jgi:hypothetical protein
VSRNPWFSKLADRQLDPKGLLSPYLYAGTGVTLRALGVAERKVSERSGEDRSYCFRSSLEFSPVIKSSVPETLKKYPCFAEK